MHGCCILCSPLVVQKGGAETYTHLINKIILTINNQPFERNIVNFPVGICRRNSQIRLFVFCFCRKYYWSCGKGEKKMQAGHTETERVSERKTVNHRQVEQMFARCKSYHSKCCQGGVPSCAGSAVTFQSGLEGCRLQAFVSQWGNYSRSTNMTPVSNGQIDGSC